MNPPISIGNLKTAGQLDVSILPLAPLHPPQTKQSGCCHPSYDGSDSTKVVKQLGTGFLPPAPAAALGPTDHMCIHRLLYYRLLKCFASWQAPSRGMLTFFLWLIPEGPGQVQAWPSPSSPLLALTLFYVSFHRWLN